MANVNITIGATLDELSSGINQAKETIQGLGEGVKALMAAFALREIVDFVEKMAEAAEHTERLATTLGVTAETAQQFELMAKLSGSSADAFAIGMQRLQLNLERGTKATGAQAAALKAMGLSAQQLAALSPDQQANKIADAYQALVAKGLNPANAMMLLFGRSAAGLGPIFAQGSKGLEEWRQKMIDVGAIVSGDTIKSLADLNKEMTLFGAAMQGLGQTVVGALATGLGQFVTQIAQAAGNLSVLIQTGNLTDYVLEYMAGAADRLGAELVKMAFQALQAGVALATLGVNTTAFQASIDKADVAVKQANQDLEDLNANFERIKRSFQGGLNFGGTSKPLNIDFGAGGAMKDAIAKADEAYKQLEAMAKQSVDAMQMTEFQKDEILKAGLKTRMDAEIAAGESRTKAEAKYAADVAKINEQETKNIVDMWKKGADAISSAFNSQLRGVLAGTTSITQAMKNIFADLIVDIIEYLVKLGLQWVATQIAMSASGTTTIGARVAQFLSQMNADAALTFGGVFANLSPLMGPAAAGPAATAQASVLAQAANVPKLDIGTPYVPRDMLAMIHQGEAVIPAGQNPFAGGGGVTNSGGNITLNVSAIDARSFAAMLNNNQSALSQALRSMARRNNSNFALATQASR